LWQGIRSLPERDGLFLLPPPASPQLKSIKIIDNYWYKYVCHYANIMPKKGNKYRIFWKVVKKEKRY